VLDFNEEALFSDREISRKGKLLLCVERTLKILQVVPTYLPARRHGGAIVSVHGLCKSLVKRGHEVHVFTTNRDGSGVSEVPTGKPVSLEGVNVWYFPTGRLRRIYYSQEMKKALKAQISTFDIVHLHAIYVWTTTFTARLCRQRNVPFVVAPQGSLERYFIRRKNYLLKLLWLRLFDFRTFTDASAIHVTSSREKRSVADYLGQGDRKIRIIDNGIDCLDGDFTGQYRNSFATSENIPPLLFLGRVSWEKGLDRLVEALQYAPNVRLIIAGPDETNYSKKLELLARKYGVVDRIFYHAAVFGNEKIALLRSSGALVLPSYAESFGIVVLEAMSVGCPVIVSPEVGLADVILKSGTGIVVDCEPRKLGHALEKFMLDRAWRLKLSENGPRTVRALFSWNEIAQRMEEVYADLLEKDCKHAQTSV
jgi:glycosyltransferase involved in cell wall biosynthesis